MTTNQQGGAWKRFFDLTVALAALVVSAPVLALIAVAIKISSRGPALFLQERIGWHGRRFFIVKFRSMVDHAPYLRNPDGSAYSSNADPRVTRLGKMLRRTSLDELPQLWNVVRGEMSLIGPRPELAEGVRTYRPADFRRLHVRPGMTGWAVVHGRNDVSVSTRRELDAWYADHVSFLLDVKIFSRTIAMVVAGKGIDRTREPLRAHASSTTGVESCSREN
jgi:lipopolysaccharide/colanic/teichoic acid biosynthesis glycosyltransferase